MTQVTQMTATDRARADLARALGVEERIIRVLQPQWTKLMKEGVIVKLHIGRWRARTKLTFDDLGIADEEEETLKLLNLGQKYLLPVEILRKAEAIESAARRCLEKHAFKTYWGLFVPVTAFEAWKEENEAHKARYLALRDEIVREDAIVEELLAQYTTVAQAAYRRLAALGRTDETEDNFVANFINRIRRCIPPQQAIYNSFTYEWELYFIPLPSLLAEDLAAAEVARAQAEEEIERERMRSRMWREVLEKAQREKEELVSGFISDVVGQLHQLVYQVAADVLAAIERNQTLPAASVVQLKNMVEQVSKLNFYDDQDLERIIKTVQTQLDKPSEARDPAKLREIFQDIEVVSRSVLAGLSVVSRGRRYEDIEPPKVEELQRSRRRLLLDADVEALPLPFRARQRRIEEIAEPA